MKKKNKAQRGRNLGTKPGRQSPCMCVRACGRGEVGGGGFIHIQASEERERIHVHSGEAIWLWEHSEEPP